MPDQPGVSDGCGVALWVDDDDSGVYFEKRFLKADPGDPTHRAFPTDAQALAEMRALIVAVLADEASTLEGDADAVLRVLFGDAARSPA